MVAGEVGGEDLALDAAMAEPARHDDPGGALERAVEVLLREGLRIDPTDLDIHVVRPAGVLERLGDRQVRVRQLDVLADERDLQGGLVALDPLDERAPTGEVRCRVRIAQRKRPHD